MKRQELYELMDCCRPDLSDLTEEEARALSEALEQDAQLRARFLARQSWDTAIGRAMHDVPVPEGLSQRLITALAAPSPAEPLAVRPAARFARRVPFPAACVVAAAAVVLCALWFVRTRQDSLTSAQVAEQCRTWITQLEPQAWKAAPEAPVADYPLDPGLRLQVVGWQSQSVHPYGQAVVYRANLSASGTAYLYAIRTARGRLLPTIPPNRPDSTTNNLCIGVWKSGACLYVLVVPGDQRDYLRALRTDNVG